MTVPAFIKKKSSGFLSPLASHDRPVFHVSELSHSKECLSEEESVKLVKLMQVEEGAVMAKFNYLQGNAEKFIIQGKAHILALCS